MHGNSRVDFANTLRGLAALAVIVSHYYGVFWLSREVVGAVTNAPALSIEVHPVPGPILFLHSIAIFNWGAFGVALFFLISGFVIPFSLQKMTWMGFSLTRLFRIVPIYFVGFSITLLAIYVSGEYFSREWPFNIREVAIHYIPGIRDMLWSRGIDGIVWTLEIEMKFYFVSAILIVWFRNQSLKVFLAPIILFALAVITSYMIPDLAKTNAAAWRIALTYMSASQYIIYMFIGVIFHYLYRERLHASKAYFGIGGLFALFCIHWNIGPYSDNLGVAWNYAFALLAFGFAYSFPKAFKSNVLVDFLAKVSYPLYVIHGVAGYVVLRVMLDIGFSAWLSLLSVTSMCLILSWLLHIVIESPSQKLGKRLAAKLSGSSSTGEGSCR